MSTKNDIKEMEFVLRDICDILNSSRDIDIEYEARKLVEEEGWHKSSNTTMQKATTKCCHHWQYIGLDEYKCTECGKKVQA